MKQAEAQGLTRRDFLKLGGAAALGTYLAGRLPQASAQATLGTAKIQSYMVGQKTPSICVYCAGGCGLLATSVGGKVIEVEGDPVHPVNEGALCSKASAHFQLINNERRLLYPLKRTNPKKGVTEDPKWIRITWNEAFDLILDKVKDAMKGAAYKDDKGNYFRRGVDSPIAWHGSAYWNNEENYLAKKGMSLIGSLNIEHQARKCHASTVVGLANTFGFGAMTNNVIDAKNSKCFLIVSNPAESHTMEFRWVTRAIEKGAKVIVLDPRYNRTASKADLYVPYRSGSEAAIFLGLIHYAIFEKPQYIDWGFVESRTNAPYDKDGNKLVDWKTNPDSMFSKLKALVQKYTLDEVERISGIRREKLVEVAETFMTNKPSNIYYAMGTTQHTNAVQAIRAHAILQLILGNVGVPGGGVNALRGISNVQGSTDMNVLSHVIAGYRVPPRDLEDVRRYQKWKNTDPEKRGGVTGGATYTPKDKIEERWDDRMFPTWNALEYNWGIFVGTWPGKNPDTEPIICDLPIGVGYPTVQLFRAIKDGKVKVAFIMGENPAVSNPNANSVREALAKEGLFLVVDEIFETETAHFADILLPGTNQLEREGSITSTSRWVQWRWKAVDPPVECKPELWVVKELFRRIRWAGVKTPSEKYQEETGNSVGSDPDACWPSAYGESAEDIYKEIGAKRIDPKIRPSKVAQLAAANALYAGSYDPDIRPDIGGILPKRRDPNPVDSQDEQYGYFKNWAWSWMRNQRVLYNLKESNPGLNTFLVWWAHSPDKWLGLDVAGVWSAPLYSPKLPDGKDRPDWHPFKHGFPLHNEPLESPDEKLAAEYPTMWDNRFKVETGGPKDYPIVMTTYRLAEHMQAGAMTRNLPWLVEAFPEMFVEMSPALAQELGVRSGDMVIVKTARNLAGERMRALVTERVKPVTVNGRTLHQVGMPWHWGFKGLSKGPSANTLCIDSVDVSANIPEFKTCLCRIEKA